MRKFSNIYNSYWLIIVTITTIGYGDIYPTTYFGRVLAILSCICGTFILSLLIVFLNAYISFDDVEKAIYNQVMDEEVRLNVIKNDAVNVIWNFLKLNYLRKVHKENTAISRFNIYLDLKYITKKFKIMRLNSLKKDIDIEEILNAIKFELERGIDPIKKDLEAYNRERIVNDDSLQNLKQSKDISESFFKNSMQMWNLARVLNKGKCLEGLKNINEVYESQVSILDEIIYYHKFNEKKNESMSMNSISNGEPKSLMSVIEEEENKEEEEKDISSESFKNESSIKE